MTGATRSENLTTMAKEGRWRVAVDAVPGRGHKEQECELLLDISFVTQMSPVRFNRITISFLVEASQTQWRLVFFFLVGEVPFKTMRWSKINRKRDIPF